MKLWNSYIISVCLVLTAVSSAKAILPYYTDSSRYDVKSYMLDLKMSHQNTIVSGFVKIWAVSKQQRLPHFFIELNSELSVSKVTTGEKSCTFSRNGKWLKIFLPQEKTMDQLFEIIIHYSGEVSKVTSMGGFRSEFMTDLQKNITYTLSEPFGAYLWFPCKQELTDKADSVFVYVTTKENIEVAANGLLKKVVQNPSKKEVRYEWASYYPTAYYLIAVAITDFKEYNYYLKSYASNDSFLFQNYYLAEPSEEVQTKKDIDQTIELMQLYEKLLSPYPFIKEKYGHCEAPIGGGMENQTITMINTFSFGLIAHELAHSWFGNMVTCSTWKDIWINEGLTSYFEYLAYEYLRPEDAPMWLAGAVIQSYTEPEGSIVIPDSELQNERRIFNYTLTYRKGAYMVHQLRLKVGNDALFFSFLKAFLKQYAYSNASVEDFKNMAESFMNINLDRFFDSWFYGSGMPKIKVSWNYENKLLNLQVQQQGTSSLTPAFDVCYELLVKFENGTDTVIRINQVFAEENMEFTMNKKVVDLRKNEDEALIIGIIESSLLRYYDVKIFPNPAYDSLNVNFANGEKNRQIEIIGANGRSFGIYYVRERKNLINIDHLPHGLYLIKVIGKKKATNLKFVKK